MDYTGKRFSVMGDSISTFRGVTIDDPITFYTKTTCRKGGLESVEDTWWMRVIQGLGGTFERDCAYSGSCVTDGYGYARGGCSEERVRALGQPDVILIFMGANDVGFQVPEEQFREAYALMLSRMKETYPAVEIWCGTLINGRKVLDDEPFFMNEDPATPIEPFSGIIRKIAADAGVCVADLAKYNILYDAIDGAHPTSGGMKTLSDLWLREMKAADSSSCVEI